MSLFFSSLPVVQAPDTPPVDGLTIPDTDTQPEEIVSSQGSPILIPRIYSVSESEDDHGPSQRSIRRRLVGRPPQAEYPETQSEVGRGVDE